LRIYVVFIYSAIPYNIEYIVTMTHSYWHLENIDLTHLLCPTKLGDESRMSKHSKPQFKKGDTIYLPNDQADKLYLVNEGRVKISTINEEGKEVTKAILGKGEMFGEMALVGEERRHDTATALEATSLCIMSVDEMRSLMRERTELNMLFMRMFGARQLEMERRLESLVFKDSRSRIVEYLVELTHSKGQRVGYEWVVRQFMTHQEIANLTATSRQTVTTTLNELRDANLLTFNRSRLLIRDLEALSKQIRA
jgi:CRP/FNR family transcriptional regulator, cyclic AMP receptor protein